MELYPSLCNLYNIPTASVDLVVTTGDLTPLWLHLNRIIKPEGAIVVYGSKEYVKEQTTANPKHYRYPISNGNTMFLSRNKVPASAVFRLMEPVRNPPWIYNPQIFVYRDEPPFTLEDYIVQTYSNPGSTVLDPYAIPDTLAAAGTREFIGIQEDEIIYEVLECMNNLI